MRKIKLMALLLAALMIVTAFAGCAGVKQEAVDDLDDRVSKIEDLLLQQNDTIKDLGDKIENGGSNNSDVLAAIESMNKDLSDKIGKLEDRVEDVENKPAAGGADTNVQAKQTEALASIAVQKAEFNKNAAEYDDEAFAAITSAFAKAEATVTAATTEAEVAAAMATLKTTLDEYKTYAMKLYDLYIALLGNINDGAEELVEDALDFIDILDEVYEDSKDINKDLQYVVAEATDTTRAKVLDVYAAVKALCEIYNNGTDVAFQYVDAKGNVKTYSDALTLQAYKAEAKEIVREIKNNIGTEGLTYKALKAYGSEALEALQDRYNTYVESAEFVGGKALVDLVTNANLLVNALDVAEALYDARDAYKELSGRISGTYQDGFYYYTNVANKADCLVIADPSANAEEGDVVFLDEYYTEKVDEVIADWIDEFDLTAEDATAIIDEAEEEEGFYKTYLQRRRKVALTAAAYSEFVKNIVPGIKSLNKLTSKSADAVEDFNELKAAVEALNQLQEKNVKSENVADQIDIYLDVETFYQFVEQSGIVAVDDITLFIVDEAEDDEVEDLVADINAGRLDDVKAITNLAEITAQQFVELFTFAADIKAIDKKATDADDDYIALRTTGEKYNFFAVEFAQAEKFANYINAAIANLVYKVENNKISSNEEFVKLAGEYVNIAFANGEFEIVYDNGTADTSDDVTFDKDYEGDEVLYVAAAEAINYAEDYKTVANEGEFNPLTCGVTDGVYVTLDLMDENQKVTRGENVFTIEFFNYAFPTFKSLINVDAFETAQTAAEARIEKLFNDIDALKAILEEVAYVRGTAYEYKDTNGNGKVDLGEIIGDTDKDGEIDEDETWTPIAVNTVSLGDKAKFDEAVKIYDAWVFAGGNQSLELFTEKLDDEGESYGGLYVMEGFANQDGVGAILATLRDLNYKFKTLTDAANAFVNAVKLVGDVNTYNSISATASKNKLSGDGDVDKFAITKFVNSESTTDNAGVNGTWTYVLLSTNGALTTDTYVDKVSDKTTGVAGNLPETAYTKAELLKKVVEFYNAFEDANIEYVAASNNDYDDAETLNFYANKGYEAYKAVDDAKATYEKYDLIAAKGACLIAAAAAATADIDDATTTFKGHIAAATTLAALDNAIANYISVGGAAPDLAGWTIYDFDSIAD